MIGWKITEKVAIKVIGPTISVNMMNTKNKDKPATKTMNRTFLKTSWLIKLLKTLGVFGLFFVYLILLSAIWITDEQITTNFYTWQYCEKKLTQRLAAEASAAACQQQEEVER